MLTPSYGDFNRVYTFMNELRRHAVRPWVDAELDDIEPPEDEWPRFNVYDAGENIMLTADIPGLSETELHLTLTQDTLCVSGERELAAPEGYSVQRRERATAKFSRSLLLPWKIVSTSTEASLKDGVLTVRLTKAPEAQPRRIAVQAS